MEKRTKYKNKKAKRKSNKSSKKKRNNSYEFINLISEPNDDSERFEIKFPSFSIIKCLYHIFLIMLVFFMLIYLHRYMKKNLKGKHHPILYKDKYDLHNNNRNQTENITKLINSKSLIEKK